MNFLDKMERKYGRYALSHLTMYIIVTYIAGYIIALAAPIMRQYLTLEPYYILHGQIWRLVSWILIPPSSLATTHFFTYPSFLYLKGRRHRL